MKTVFNRSFSNTWSQTRVLLHTQDAVPKQKWDEAASMLTIPEKKTDDAWTKLIKWASAAVIFIAPAKHAVPERTSNDAYLARIRWWAVGWRYCIRYCKLIIGAAGFGSVKYFYIYIFIDTRRYKVDTNFHPFRDGKPWKGKGRERVAHELSIVDFSRS